MSKIIIVGGVAGGATAAGRIRRLDKQAEIIMLERGAEISYSNCGLPYYISGLVPEKETLIASSPEAFAEKYHLDIRVRNEAVAIHPASKTISIFNHTTGETYEERYDKLLLSPGSKSVIPEIPGTDLTGVFHLHTYADTVAIRDYIEAKEPKTAIVVGAGFIGLEVVENLKERGMDVTLVQRSNQLFSPIDPDMSVMVEEMVVQHGVKVVKNATVTAITAQHQLEVALQDGQPVVADMVILAIGVVPESKFAAEAGLTTGLKNAIVTNEKMQTSDSHIYAIGDAVETTHVVSGKPVVLTMAGPTHMQARVAAANMTGAQAVYRGSLGSSILKIFDLTVASTGLNTKQALEAGFQVDSAVISSISHAVYYPDWEEFTLKLIYEIPTGRILGAQVVGGEGSDKRCDTIAAAVYAGLTTWDLEQLQICYAPPYAIPREAINILAGMINEKLEAL